METTKNNRPKSLDEACQLANRPAVDFAKFTDLPSDLVTVFNGMYNGIVITEAINVGTKPDVAYPNVRKWHPWFKTSGAPAGFAFDESGYDCGYAAAGSGSRLQYHNEEDSDYSAEAFPEIWKDIQLG